MFVSITIRIFSDNFQSSPKSVKLVVIIVDSIELNPRNT